MDLQRFEWHDLPNASQAREQAEVAMAIGAALIAFGVVMRLLLRES